LIPSNGAKGGERVSADTSFFPTLQVDGARGSSTISRERRKRGEKRGRRGSQQKGRWYVKHTRIFVRKRELMNLTVGEECTDGGGSSAYTLTWPSLVVLPPTLKTKTEYLRM